MKLLRSLLDKLVEEARVTNPKLYTITKVIRTGIFWLISFGYIALLLISFGLGFLSSGKASTLQHTGIATLSDFEQPDFNERYFLLNYTINQTYSYATQKNLVITIQNKYVKETGGWADVMTKLEAPKFVNVTCEVIDPQARYDSCERYILPQHKQLAFNITVNNTDETTARFCLITESWSRWWLFINDKKNCITVNISKAQ